MSNVPSYIKFSQEDANDFGSVSLPTISMPGNGIFKLRFGGAEETVQGPLRVVIVGIAPKGPVKHRTFYSSTWKSGDVDSPNCMSADGVRPTGGQDPMQVDSCAVCPNSQWGSEPVRGKGQACKEGKTLYVIRAEDVGNPTAIVFQHRVSTTSMKGLATYGNLLRQYQIPMTCLVTLMGYDPTVAHQQLELSREEGYLEETQYQFCTQIAERPDVLALVAPAVVPALPAPMARPTYEIDPPAPLPPPPEAPPVIEEPVALAPEPVAPVIEPVAVTAPAPVAQAVQADPLTDARGFIWDGRIHASTKNTNVDGTWRYKRGLDRAAIPPIEAELMGGAAVATAEATTEPETAPDTSSLQAALDSANWDN